jgi:DNA-binding transcriptional LysR family regulator
MQTKLSLDDLHLIRAIVDGGSLSAAARRLKVNHSSAFRRLGSLEEQLGVRLFERTRNGYTATPAGESAFATACRVVDELDALRSRLAGADMRPSGVVRLTTTDTLVDFLGPMLAAFRAEHPEITVELIISNAFFTLTRRDADIALRPAADVPEHLVGRRLSGLATALYGTSAELKALKRGTDIRTLSWVAPDESLSHLASARWIAREVAPERVGFRASSLMGLATAAQQGLGVAALPCCLADRLARLKRLSSPVEEMASALWLLTHPDLRGVARVRALVAFASAWLVQRRPELEGTEPSARDAT